MAHLLNIQSDPHIQSDPLKNRLNIMVNRWRRDDMRAYVQDIESACSALIPGFTCLFVLNGTRHICQTDIDLLASTVDLVSAYGAGRVAYILKDEKNVFTPRSIPFYATSFTQIERACSIREAESILAA